jgi:hypothetical protein
MIRSSSATERCLPCLTGPWFLNASFMPLILADALTRSPPTSKPSFLKLEEGLVTCTRLRRFLVEHPLLVLELGFRPVLDLDEPYGFDVERTVPTARWLREQQRTLSSSVLHALLIQTVLALHEEVPGLGDVVAFDVTHMYAWVRENNPRVYVEGTFDVTHIPKGDPDCRLGVKKSSNQVQADGTTKTKKESLFGYGSGIDTSTNPVYCDVILAEYTQPFNEGDITYFPTLYIRAIAALGFFPTHITADAAFDAWYTYQTVAQRGGIAAIPLNQHGHPESRRAPDGVPLCAKGLRMHPAFQYAHTYGYRSQRCVCPLLFPQPTGETCDHPQFARGQRLRQGPQLGAGWANARDLRWGEPALQGHLSPANQYGAGQQSV